METHHPEEELGLESMKTWKGGCGWEKGGEHWTRSQAAASIAVCDLG